MEAKPQEIQARATEFRTFSQRLGRKARRTAVQYPWTLAKRAYILLTLRVAGEYQIAFYDPDHSEDEYREILIAHSREGRLLVVIYTLRGNTIRIISARRATHREAEDYAQGI